jgi:hypothetical protein
VAPSADLVAEDTEVSGPSRSDDAFCHDAAIFPTVTVRDRGHLDDEWSVGDRDEGGVVERVPGPSLDESEQRLEDPPADAYDVRASTERQPVEVNAGCGRIALGGLDRACPGGCAHGKNTAEGMVTPAKVRLRSVAVMTGGLDLATAS